MKPRKKISKKGRGIRKAFRQYTQQEAPEWQEQKLALAKGIVTELKDLNTKVEQLLEIAKLIYWDCEKEMPKKRKK